MPPAERLRGHDVRLEDGELVLRPLTEDDWNALARWRLDPEVLLLAELDDVPERSLGELQAIVREVSQTAFCWIAELDGAPVGDLWLEVKVRRNKAYRRHLLAGRSTKRKRKMRRPGLVSPGEVRTYLRLLGEG